VDAPSLIWALLTWKVQMKIPKGMEAGDDHPVAQAIRERFPTVHIGATRFTVFDYKNPDDRLPNAYFDF